MPKRFHIKPQNRFRILRQRIIMAPLRELVEIEGCGTECRAGNSNSRWNVSLSAYIRRSYGLPLQALKQKSQRLPFASSVSFSLALVTISRRFEKRSEGWPTAFCPVLFSPAGDPLSSAFASDLSIFSFSLHSSCAFFVSLWPPPEPLHCILLWSRAT